MSEKNKIILRWIAVPFAAILASIVVNLIGKLWVWINGNGIEYYTGGTSSISIVTILLYILLNCSVGFAFVWLGACVAPSHQKNVAIVLATIQVCICVMSAILMLLGYADNSLSTWAAIVASSIGGIYAATKNEYKLS